jgi:magnesium transporter
MAENRFLEVVPDIKELLAEQNWPGLNLILGDYQPGEVAEAWEEFTLEERLAILRHFEVAHAVDIFENIDHGSQILLLESLREKRATALLDEMAPDERADLFAEFPPRLQERFLRLMETKEAQDVRELLAHAPDSAGGLMTTDFAWVDAGATVGDAIRRIRENFRDTEAVYYVYVLGPDDHLEGVVTLKQLLLAEPETPIRELMRANLITIDADMDQEHVAREAALCDLLALPVVNARGRMLGIVTHDDVMDVVDEEAGEDIELFGAVIPGEEGRDYLSTPVLEHCRARIPWLVVLLFLGSVSGFLIIHFERVMKSGFDIVWYGLLFSLTPMLCGTAGNAATQSATVVIRALATGELDLMALGRVVRKELLVGLLMGAILALCGFGRAMISHTATVEQALVFGGIVSLSIFLAIIYATTAGAFLPLLFKRLNLDPAVMSSPLLATINDSVVILIYFSVAIFSLLHLPSGGLT